MLKRLTSVLTNRQVGFPVYQCVSTLVQRKLIKRNNRCSDAVRRKKEVKMVKRELEVKDDKNYEGRNHRNAA